MNTPRVQVRGLLFGSLVVLSGALGVTLGCAASSGNGGAGGKGGGGAGGGSFGGSAAGSTSANAGTDGTISGGAGNTSASGIGGGGASAGSGGNTADVDATTDGPGADRDYADASARDGTDGAAGGDAGVAATIQFYGRWNHQGARATTVNSGSHVTAIFTGTGLGAMFDVSNVNAARPPTVAWRVDDTGAWQEATIAATLPLASGLAPGQHTVFLMARGMDEQQNRWNPPLVAATVFLGFSVTGGALVPAVPPARKRLEFLGDSITEGVFMYPDRTGKTGGAWRTDARVSYPSLTATALGADWSQVGFGSQGVTVGGNGNVPNAVVAFNFIYAGAPRDPTWLADMVVINQGTNDRAATADAYRLVYAMFLMEIRQAYPTAKIVAMRPFNGAHAADIQAAITARRAAGDSNVFYVDTTGWLTNADFSDGLHPNPQGSTKVSAKLVPALQALLN